MSGKLTFTVSPQRPPELQLSSQLTVCMRAKAMQGGKMTAQMQNIVLNLELHSAISGGIVFIYLFPLFVCLFFIFLQNVHYFLFCVSETVKSEPFSRSALLKSRR